MREGGKDVFTSSFFTESQERVRAKTSLIRLNAMKKTMSHIKVYINRESVNITMRVVHSLCELNQLIRTESQKYIFNWLYVILKVCSTGLEKKAN